ncbi:MULTISPECIES: anhydro-N-acetylmuramic acid kinase [Halocynthiibacter]|uniref:Anhydro-N-acetylmuramic acid kinase n=1 Tax=Halocynthiibacter halioticoli TaxID=2986804 RepID=A0AAE3LR10_9RHOB|nr:MULTISPECIES: anhydro-N-acetylmuramic acid kinase [Halocynthiibacter]MCV6824113.1 anhydro-N-acetylmuramic acid kinase [Halocynthiibacter halioticoli]MCW4057114.1 anhydro-N-acetylmuramic acid kinase [Halocynthiibacter sp. SDUM655004]
MLKSGPVWAIGTMSGTSLDGVDAAAIQTDGERIYEFGESAYHPYSSEERAPIAAALGLWPGDARVEEAAEVIETVHATLLSQFERPALIGFHGQTLAHDPRGRGTHQAGNGRVLAEVLDCPVVWDFRSTDVEMGGEGAPLAPFFHFACAKFMEAEGPVVFLNLGGVGNMTWVDPSATTPDEEGALLAFDTGPANAPINDLMLSRRGESMDKDGALAADGDVDEALVEQFLEEPYFYRMPPKSLDRDSFPDIADWVGHMEDADAVATVTAMVAASAAKGLEHCPSPPTGVLVCGGGRKNPTLMAMLSVLMDCPVAPIENAGFDGDMLEAQAFGFLGVRVARGLTTSCPGTTGVRAPVGGGTVSEPTGALAQSGTS